LNVVAATELFYLYDLSIMLQLKQFFIQVKEIQRLNKEVQKMDSIWLGEYSTAN